MDGVKSILIFCAWLGTVMMCAALVFSGIIRWLKPRETHKKRLNILSGAAAVILVILFLISNNIDVIALLGTKGNNEQISDVFINVSKITIKLLMLGAVVISAAMLLFAFFFFVCNVVKTTFKHGKFECDDQLVSKFQEKSQCFKGILKAPITMFIITWGIIAIFVVLPLLMGDGESHSMAETWCNGVYRIAYYPGTSPKEDKTEDRQAEKIKPTRATADVPKTDKVKNKKKGVDDCDTTEKSFYAALAKYILIFIIVLGVGVTVVKILYLIIENTFTREQDRTVLDEYSSPIGVLAVGVALLWAIQKIDFSKEGQPLDKVCGFAESFMIVAFAIALGILTLEIIRLLLDMRESLIRQEARYLFAILIGQTTIILLEIIWSLCGAVNSAIGNPVNSEMEQFRGIVRNKVIQTMEKHMDGKAPGRKDQKQVFSDFEKKITKK